MALVTYNGVSLPYSFLTDYRQEAKYEESDTDRYLTSFNVNVQCVINQDHIPMLLGQAEVVGSPADVLRLARTLLLTPRKKLSIVVNGKEMVPQAQAGNRGTADAKNGPHPQSCSITVVTSNTFLVTFHIIAHYWENLSTPLNLDDATNNPGSPVLYNRWTESVEIDNCLYTTKTREGKFQIRSDNIQGTTADTLRDQMAVTAVAPGFLRTSSHYSISPDGLVLSYRIVDKEQFKLPPSPAYEAQGVFTMSAAKMGPLRQLNVRLRLKGAKNTSQTQLILAALTTARIKLNTNAAVFASAAQVAGQAVGAAGANPFLAGVGAGIAQVGIGGIPVLAAGGGNNAVGGGGGGGQANRFLLNGSISIEIGMFENYVEVQMSALINGQLGRIDQTTLLPQTVVPGAGFTPSYPSRGTASFVLLQAAAYYDPSLANIRLGTNDQLQNGVGGATLPQVGTLGKNP